MKSGMHRMPDGSMMKDSEMQGMMKREKMGKKPMMRGEQQMAVGYQTPGWAKKREVPAKTKAPKRKGR